MSLKEIAMPISGHAPGHLREAFAYPWDYACDGAYPWVDGGWWQGYGEPSWLEIFDSGQLLERLTRMPAAERAKWITGQLWNCSDVMPGLLCDDLELVRGSTYGRAAQLLGSQVR
jgi:hypothetical protein